jgi:hypothetical protein
MYRCKSLGSLRKASMPCATFLSVRDVAKAVSGELTVILQTACRNLPQVTSIQPLAI